MQTPANIQHQRLIQVAVVGFAVLAGTMACQSGPISRTSPQPPSATPQSPLAPAGPVYRPESATIATVAGNGEAGFAGDGQAATSATLSYPEQIACDLKGNLLIGDPRNGRLRSVGPDGVIRTVVGGAPDSAPAIAASGVAAATGIRLVLSTDWQGPRNGFAFALDPKGMLWLNGPMARWDGQGQLSLGRPPATDPVLEAQLACALPSDLPFCFDAAGTMYFVGGYGRRVWKWAGNGDYSILVGNRLTNQRDAVDQAITAPSAHLLGATSLLAANGNLYIAEAGANCIRKVDSQGMITRFAGVAQAEESMAVAAVGDFDTECVRSSPTGIPYQGGTQSQGGFSGDGGPALQAKLNGPAGLAMDAAGNLYFADRRNSVVRRIDSRGIITTVVGTPPATVPEAQPLTPLDPRSLGEGGLARNAKLDPGGLAFAANGDLYIADRSHNRIRKVTFNAGGS